MPRPERKADMSNVVKITTAVPYGKHVACTDLIPDPAPYAAAIGGEIGEVRDRGKSNSEATAVCALIRAGEPPKTDMELETLAEKYQKLGVLPGDEYCTVTAYCSLATDTERFKEKCEKDGRRVGVIDGQVACVRETQRGVEYAYTYRVIDPDTKCVLEVMGGPSVTDEALVQGCTSAALTTISTDNLKYE